MKVFLHGFMGDPSIWDDVRAHLPANPRGNEDLVPALLGHDAHTGEVTSFEDEVARLSWLIQAKRSGPVHLIGYSLGARVALGVAASIAIDRLTILSGRDGLLDAHERRERVQHDEAWAARLEACQDKRAFAELLAQWDAQPVFQTRSTQPEEAWRARRLEHVPRRLASAMRVLSLGRMPIYAPRVRCAHVDVVVGAQDTKFCGLADPLAASLGAQRTTLPHVGHDLPREAPQELARLLNGRRE